MAFLNGGAGAANFSREFSLKIKTMTTDYYQPLPSVGSSDVNP